MKKILIVLLSILLALSFILCEKDKSEEVIANYEEFAKACSVGMAAIEFFPQESKALSDITIGNDESFLVALLSNTAISVSSDNKFTSATANGKTVDVRLINATYMLLA